MSAASWNFGSGRKRLKFGAAITCFLCGLGFFRSRTGLRECQVIKRIGTKRKLLCKNIINEWGFWMMPNRNGRLTKTGASRAGEGSFAQAPRKGVGFARIDGGEGLISRGDISHQKPAGNFDEGQKSRESARQWLFRVRKTCLTCSCTWYGCRKVATALWFGPH